MSELLPVGTKIKIISSHNDDFQDMQGWIGTIRSYPELDEGDYFETYYEVDFGVQPEDIGIIEGPEYFLIHPTLDKFEVVE